MWTVFWLFSVIPIVALTVILARFLEGTATYSATELPFARGLEQFWPKPAAPISMIIGDHLRFDKGPSYFVWLTPYGYAGLWLACAISALHLRRFYRT